MDPTYQTIIDPSEFIWMGLGYGLHLLAFLIQAGLAFYLLAKAARGTFLLRTSTLANADPRLSFIPSVAVPSLLAVGLLLPLSTGLSMWIATGASLSGIALLMQMERFERARPSIARLRKSMPVLVAAAAVFSLWEGEDNLVLGHELFGQAISWRSHEMDWQRANDPAAPKVGDIAPDFALQNPDGTKTVRLSDFRGTRPVVLAFGSYT